MTNVLDVEVFKTGMHTDANGQTRSWSIEDLDRIATAYNEQHEHEAPVVLGHPRDNAPAYGWVESLKRIGETLYARCTQLAPEFVEAVKAGRFKKRSISLYPDMRLRHVGWLGAVPPAIKGLKDVAFSEGGEITYEFSENWQWESVHRILSRIRDMIIEEKGLEEADKIFSVWDLESVLPPPAPTTSTIGYVEPPADDINHHEDHTMTIEELQAENARLKAEMDAERQKNEQLANQQRKAELMAFLDSESMRERVPAARRSMIVEIMTDLTNSEISFSEFNNDGKEETIKKSSLDAFKEFLQSLPKVVEMSEIATRDQATIEKNDPEIDHAKRIAGSVAR